MNEYLPVIQKAALFAGVESRHLETILPCLAARTARFSKGAVLLRPGDQVEWVGLLLEGSALIVQEDFWGNRNVVAHLAPGQLFAEVFACSGGATATVSVVAEASCAVMFLDLKRIMTNCPATCSHHTRVILNLLSDLAQKNLHLQEKLTHLGQRTTREKLLSYLSAESQRQRRAEFDIPFSRQQLADYLSVERSGLSAALSKLQSDGLLSYHKNHFTLLFTP